MLIAIIDYCVHLALSRSHEKKNISNTLSERLHVSMEQLRLWCRPYVSRQKLKVNSTHGAMRLECCWC